MPQVDHHKNCALYQGNVRSHALFLAICEIIDGQLSLLYGYF